MPLRSSATDEENRHNQESNLTSSQQSAALKDDENGTSDTSQPRVVHSPEHEPLILPPSYTDAQVAYSATDHEEDAQQPFMGKQKQDETKSTLYLILLSCCMGGLQLAWSVEMASISPFLLELGLSKSLLALVWIAGPLSGTIVQPYVGIKSDACDLRFGRRRPFMISGAVATAISLLALAWTQNIVSTVFGFFGVSPDAHATVVASQVWAVVLVYVLDVAVNVLQAGNRAFIVDCAPTHQQESANAIANVVTGMGGIVGYLCGQAQLTTTFPFLGDSHFKVLCAIACVVLACTMSISCVSIKERDPRSFGPPTESHGPGLFSFFKTLVFSVRALPPQIRKVCIVQIFNWIAWFPFLFYTTTYIGGLYAEPFLLQDPNMTDDDLDDLFEEGARQGTHAMLIFSIITLSASILLPLMIARTYMEPERSSSTPLTPLTTSTHSLLSPIDRNDYFLSKTSSRRSRKARLKTLLGACSIRVPWLTIRRAWITSHVAFAIMIWLTMFTRTPGTATLVVATIGIPWALTNWAPFALIAAEISRRDAIRRGVRQCTATADGNLPASELAGESADQAGVVLGIHNVAVAAPQVIATLVSSLIFRTLQKPRGVPGDDSVGWVLRLGGLSALGAAWFARHIEERSVSLRHEPDTSAQGQGHGRLPS